MKRVIIFIITLLYVTSWGQQTIVSAAIVAKEPQACIPTTSLYQEQQQVLAYECCPATASAGASNTPAANSTTSPSTGKIGCGNDANNDPKNKQDIWDFLVSSFVSKGFEPGKGGEAEAAAGAVMGNMHIETGGTFNPNIAHGEGCGPGKPAIGLNQWCFSRISNLESFAAKEGTSRGCLETQLKFLWHEMEKDFSHLFPLMKGKSAGEAASIFDDGGDGPSGGVQGFEESIASDNSKREGRAEQLYSEYSGKTVGSSPSSSTSGANTTSSSTSATNKNCTKGSFNKPLSSSTAIPPAECNALVDQVKQLIKDGKLIDSNESVDPNSPTKLSANTEKDLGNCTDQPIECGTGGKGGVDPKMLRAVVAVTNHIDSKGLGPVGMWSFNTGHDCGKGVHKEGKAVDFAICNAGTGDAKCDEMFKYIVDHSQELGVKQVIWSQPPAGYSCGQGPILCLSDHYNEIHMGF